MCTQVKVWKAQFQGPGGWVLALALLLKHVVVSAKFLLLSGPHVYHFKNSDTIVLPHTTVMRVSLVNIDKMPRKMPVALYT